MGARIVIILFGAIFFVALLLLAAMVNGNGEVEDMPSNTQGMCEEFDITNDACSLVERESNEQQVESSEAAAQDSEPVESAAASEQSQNVQSEPVTLPVAGK